MSFRAAVKSHLPGEPGDCCNALPFRVFRVFRGFNCFFRLNDRYAWPRERGLVRPAGAGETFPVKKRTRLAAVGEAGSGAAETISVP